MLRWYVASLVFLLVVSPAIGYAAYHYVMTHPAKPGTLAGRVYERTVKKKLLSECGTTMRSLAKAPDNTDAQFDAACLCFSDAMFEKFRDVPPGDLEMVANAKETQRSAEAIFKNCASQSGLN